MRSRLYGALISVCGAAVLAGAGGAAAGLIGVNEDATKFAEDGGAALFAQMQEIGLRQNVVSAVWTAGRQLNATDVNRISKAVTAGKARGVKVVIQIYPASGSNARALGTDGGAAFLAYLKQVVGTFHSTVKEFIVLNEPNRTIFASPVDPALTAKVLADAYDAIKQIDSGANVIGLGLSPRGTGDGRSLFPVQFLAQLGAAYKALNRTAPLMDAISFHPYPFPENKAPDKTSDWPTIGMPDLARLKQAIWDAFNGTNQKTVDAGLPIHLDEVAYQVPTDGKPGYTGSENVRTVDEATQAAFYAQIVNQVACDPTIASLSFFHFVDETERAAFQSGFLDVAQSGRPVVASVKQALAATSGGSACSGSPVSWKPETGVVGFDPGFAADGKTALRNKSKVFGFAPTAEEDATFKAGVFPAGTPSDDAARALAVRGRLAADAKPLLTVSGKIPAMLSSLAKFELARKNGSFVYAITVTSVTNPNRTETAVSDPFSVGTGAPAKGGTPTVSSGRGPRIRIVPTRGARSATYAVGSQLTVERGTWTGSPRFAYSWKRCNARGGSCLAIPRQTSSRYLLSAADVGSTIRADVTATNAAGTATATTAATPVIAVQGRGATLPPRARNRPSIRALDSTGRRASGRLTPGIVLSGFPGNWTGTPRFTYAWQRCSTAGGSCTAIPGQSTSSYTITSSDVGFTLRFVVTATNAAGSTVASRDSTRVFAGTPAR